MSIVPDDPITDVDHPFAGIQRALEEGRLSLEPDDTPRIRTYIPDYTGISTVSREEQIRLGSNTREPECSTLKRGIAHLKIRRPRDELPEEVTRAPSDAR